jgi:hypothetical protein
VQSVPFTTNFVSNSVRIPLGWGVLDTFGDKVCQWLVAGHDITEILLKVALNTKTMKPNLLCSCIMLLVY